MNRLFAVVFSFALCAAALPVQAGQPRTDSAPVKLASAGERSGAGNASPVSQAGGTQAPLALSTAQEPGKDAPKPPLLILTLVGLSLLALMVRQLRAAARQSGAHPVNP